MKQERITLRFDGGSRGNPGPAGIGIVLQAQDHTPLLTLGRYVGARTNNGAEYMALITGLEEAAKLGVKHLVVRGDSELIIRQMKGEYRVRHPDLKPLYERAIALAGQFDSVQFEHNVRDHNQLADKLANLAMDRRTDVHDAVEESVDAPVPQSPKPGDRFVCPRCACAIDVRVVSRIRPHQLKDFVCQCGMRMNRI